MAAGSLVLEEALTNRNSRIVVLEKKVADQYSDFQALIRIEQEKFQIQKEITAHTEAIANTYQEEKKSLKKQVRRLKWQRIGLGVIAVVALVL